jgi:hypothetical protein
MMEIKDEKELRRLVQLYHMPAVLTALADIVLDEVATPYREVRDTSSDRKTKVRYRKYTGFWDELSQALRRYARMTSRLPRR